jgi:multidrug efflux pump subunit AcrA (membrane-fusion protein)
MKRFILPLIGVLAAAGSAYSIARTTPHRERTDPPSLPPVSNFGDTVAAVGVTEASTENIAIGTPISGIVPKVFVRAGDEVKDGDPLFELDTRHLRAELEVRKQARAVARSRAKVTEARLDDLRRQLAFAEQIKDKRAISSEELSRRRSAVKTAQAEYSESQAQVAAADAQVQATAVEIERSTVRSPIDAEVLQVKLRVGEFAAAGYGATPLIVLGRSKPLHVRVDVDEHEGWRVRAGASAVARVRGNSEMKTPLSFVRFEPYVVPKKSLTGDSTERVDTRVLQVIYKVERDDLPLFVGEQVDVFIDAADAQSNARVDAKRGAPKREALR